MSANFKRCPYCAEEIRVEAIKCKHCGEFVRARVSLISGDIEEEIKEAIRTALREGRPDLSEIVREDFSDAFSDFLVQASLNVLIEEFGEELARIIRDVLTEEFPRPM